MEENEFRYQPHTIHRNLTQDRLKELKQSNSKKKTGENLCALELGSH